MIKYCEKIRIKSGKIEFPRKKIEESISKLPDGNYFFTIEKFYKLRSVQQNRAKFGIAYKILKACFSESYGESVSIEFVHEYCKQNFLPAGYVERLKEEHEKNKILVNYNTGQEIEIPFRLTTTKLTTIEEMEYYKNMQRFCAEFFNQDIPDPESK